MAHEPGLHELITARRTELQEQADKLSEQLDTVRGELAELDVADSVARRLVGQRQAAETRPAAPGNGVRPGTRLIPDYSPGDRPEVTLPAAYRQLIADLKERPEPVMARDLCSENPHHAEVEGVRTKLNKLAERGWITKEPNGRFAALG